MDVHMRTLPDADLGIPKGGVAPDTGHKLRIGIATPAAVPQLQGNQRHTEALSRTWNRQFRAHAHRCLMCTPRSARTLLGRPARPPSGEPVRGGTRRDRQSLLGVQDPVETLQIDDALEVGLQADRTPLLEYLHLSVALAAVASAIYGIARAAGLADLGRRVDLAECSVRRGEGDRELSVHSRDAEGDWD